MEASDTGRIESGVHFPQEQEDNPKGATSLRATINGLNTISGVGTLAIPFALSEGGWLTLPNLCIIALLFWYTGILLYRCLESDTTVKSYPDVGEIAFGYKGRVVVSIVLFLELYVYAVQYLIFGGDNLAKLFPTGFGNFTHHHLIKPKEMFTILIALIILPATWLKKIDMLTCISFGGVLCSAIILISVFWIGVVQDQGFNQKGSLIHFTGMSNSISIITFCYCGHSVFPSLYNSMKQKTQFPKVMSISFLLATLIHGLMGIMGYLMYGKNVKSELTLNLPSKLLTSRVVICTSLIKPLTNYAMVIIPMAETIEQKLPTHTFNKLSCVILIRTILVISTTVVALILPFFGPVMALGGAFLGVICCLLLPCLCYLKIFGKRISWVEVVLVVVILCIAVFIGVSGTYTSLRDIINLKTH